MRNSLYLIVDEENIQAICEQLGVNDETGQNKWTWLDCLAWLHEPENFYRAAIASVLCVSKEMHLIPQGAMRVNPCENICPDSLPDDDVCTTTHAAVAQ
jgi:hypothetical protein